MLVSFFETLLHLRLYFIRLLNIIYCGQPVFTFLYQILKKTGERTLMDKEKGSKEKKTKGDRSFGR